MAVKSTTVATPPGIPMPSPIFPSTPSAVDVELSGKDVGLAFDVAAPLGVLEVDSVVTWGAGNWVVVDKSEIGTESDVGDGFAPTTEQVSWIFWKKSCAADNVLRSPALDGSTVNEYGPAETGEPELVEHVPLTMMLEVIE